MVGVLLAFGVEAELALASVLAYRAVAIWLPAPIGLVALGGLRRTVARWAPRTRLAPRRPRPPAAGGAPTRRPAASLCSPRHERARPHRLPQRSGPAWRCSAPACAAAAAGSRP